MTARKLEAAPKLYRSARIASAIVLAVVAVRHAALAARGDGDVSRHGVFVGVNLVVAALLVARPRWAYYPVLALSLQQMISHGADLSASFLGTAPLDLGSLAVCLFFPTLVTILFIERSDAEERADLPP